MQNLAGKDRYNWLIESFEKEFHTEVIKKKTADSYPKALMEENRLDFVIQALEQDYQTPWLSGSRTDNYQVNIYISVNVQDPKALANKIHHYLRNTLAGTDAGDLFLNTSRAEYHNYWFRLAVLEGV